MSLFPKNQRPMGNPAPAPGPFDHEVSVALGIFSAALEGKVLKSMAPAVNPDGVLAAMMAGAPDESM